MKKTLSGLILAGALTSVFAASMPEGATLSIGAGSIDLNGESESTTFIGASFPLGSIVSTRFEGNVGDTTTMTFFGLGADYKKPQFTVGIKAGLSSAVIDGTTDSTSFVGLTYGATAKYKFTENHGVLLDYTTGTLTDDSGLIDIDATSVAIAYNYTF